MKTLSIDQRFNRLEEEINIIKKMLNELLSRTAPNSKESNLKEIMTVKQVADFMGFDISVIYAKCSKGDMPYFKVGKQYRFKKVDILKWIREQKSESPFSVENYVERYLQKHELKG